MSVPPVFPPYEIVKPTPIAEIAAPSTAFDSKSFAINGSVIIIWNNPNKAELIAVQNMVFMHIVLAVGVFITIPCMLRAVAEVFTDCIYTPHQQLILSMLTITYQEPIHHPLLTIHCISVRQVIQLPDIS